MKPDIPPNPSPTTRVGRIFRLAQAPLAQACRHLRVGTFGFWVCLANGRECERLAFGELAVLFAFGVTFGGGESAEGSSEELSASKARFCAAVNGMAGSGGCKNGIPIRWKNGTSQSEVSGASGRLFYR
jgi:hypothetical protein